MVNNNSQTVVCNIKDNTLDASNNIQQSATFKQKAVSLLSSVKPYILPVGGLISLGAIIGWMSSGIVSYQTYLEQEVGSYQCFNENEIASDESKKKMLSISITTSLITSVLSPLLYSVYNSRGTAVDSTSPANT